jgi:hypothetical protein
VTHALCRVDSVVVQVLVVKDPDTGDARARDRWCVLLTCVASRRHRARASAR